jgi:hydroxymethylglutaryl-CoA lyase
MLDRSRRPQRRHPVRRRHRRRLRLPVRGRGTDGAGRRDHAPRHAPVEVALADTIGVAAPGEVGERFRSVAEAIPGIRLRGHFHNTRNTGYANAYAAIQAGVTVLDSSIGGIGGCPFAPAATGNIATEDLCYMLERMGVATGLSTAALVAVSHWLETELAHGVPALLGKAGAFPRA